MTSEIKQRIEQINNGQVPTGYKETEFGIFPCDWVTDKTFGDLFSFNGGLSKSREELSENGIEYLHYGDMHRSDFNIASLEQYSKLPKYDTKIKGDESFLMQDGDVAFLDASEDLEGTSRSVLIDNPENKPFIAGLHIIYGKPRGKELSKYYKQYLTRPEYIKKQFKKLASGFKVYGLNRNTITGIKCAYPKSTAEQEKIAEILMKWDKAIELYNQQIEKLTLLKSSCIKKMFPQKGEKVPEWRFKGFSNAWEQRKVSDLAEKTYGGGTPTTSNEAYWNGDIPWIQSSDVVDGKLLGVEPRKWITQDGLNNSAAQLIPGNSIAIITRVGVGKLAFMPYSYATSQDFLSLSKLNAEPLFTVYACYKKLQSELNAVQGTSIKGITKDELLAKNIMVPRYAEQQQIGAFFKQLDNLITLHQRKVEIIIKQRKALQQYLLNGIVRV